MRVFTGQNLRESRRLSRGSGFGRVAGEPLLPKTRLEVTKRLLIEADRLVRHNLLECGAPAPVLWELTSWLEAELPRILELVMPMAELFEDPVFEPEPEPEVRDPHSMDYHPKR